MDTAISVWMSILRNKKTTRREFRYAADQVSRILAYKALQHIPTSPIKFDTPIAATKGTSIQKSIIIVPILRSGMAMLPSFIGVFPDASVGVVGLKRDEKTAVAHWYYHNMPPIDNNTQIIIIDPMIATGGTALETIQFLIEQHATRTNLMMVSIVSAPQGIDAIAAKFPDVHVICAAHDGGLTKDKYITPGLGDFGDRYFGTEL